jgi:hypothetical protein
MILTILSSFSLLKDIIDNFCLKYSLTLSKCQISSLMFFIFFNILRVIYCHSTNLRIQTLIFKKFKYIK